MRKIILPNEILAVTTERGMFEKSRDELVIFDFTDVLLLEGALSHPGLHGAHGLFSGPVVAIGIFELVLLRHLRNFLRTHPREKKNVSRSGRQAFKVVNLLHFLSSR